MKIMENVECSCSCCNKIIEKRPFEFNIYRVRGLNKPYTRTGRVFGNILQMIDSLIGIVTFGHFGSNIGAEWIRRDLDKFFQYDVCNETKYKTGELKFELKRFKFKIWRVGKIRTPFTRSEKVFGHILNMIDAIIGISTFGHFDSFLSHEFSSMRLNKLRIYIDKYGIGK